MKKRKVEIKTDGTPGNTEIFIDGEKQTDIMEINFHVAMGGLGELTLKTLAGETRLTGFFEEKE